MQLQDFPILNPEYFKNGALHIPRNTDKAILYTLFPNVLIFGLLIAILIGFPGWKAPFSNTLGFVAAKGSGIKDHFETLLN